MKTSMKRAVAALVLTLGATPVLAASCEESYVATAETVLAKRCVACHNKASPGAGVSFQRGTGYANLVNVASTQNPEMMRVTPGDLEASYLIHKLRGTHESVGGSGSRMPVGGKLNDKELALVEAWVTECAVEGAEEAASEDASSEAPSSEAPSSEAPSSEAPSSEAAASSSEAPPAAK